MIPTLEQFLGFLSKPETIALIGGGLLAVLAEYVPSFYQKLVPKWKKATFLIACLGGASLIALGQVLFGFVTDVSFINHYWPALYRGGVAFGSGTGLHMMLFQGKGK